MARRQRHRTEQTRRALIAAARSLFREHGYMGTSVAEITTAADRAHGTFYLYFDNKRDVFSALLAEMAEGITDSAREYWHESPLIDAIWLGVKNFFDDVAANRDLWRLLEEMAAVDDDAVAQRMTLRRTFSEAIKRGIEVSRDEPTDELDPAILAELLTAIVFRFARLGRLPASAEVLSFHITVVWARGLGYDEAEIDKLRARRFSQITFDSDPPTAYN